MAPVMATTAATAWAHALDFLFPPRCAECKIRGTPLCPPCAAAVERYYGPQAGGVVAALVFTGATRACIHALKYDGQRRYAPILAALASPALVYLPPPDALVPVPLAPQRARSRGFNQSALIADALAAPLGWQVEPHWLVRVRETPPQVGQDRAARRGNMVGAFVADAAVWGRHICVVDDVMTTGATLNACTTALWAMGAASVRAFVVAYPKRNSERDADVYEM